MVGCPGCGSKLVFDIATQQMKCVYCGKFYLVSEVEKRSRDAEEHDGLQDDAIMQAQDMEVTVFTCSQCGAEIVADSDEAVTWCSYCCSPATLKSRLSRIRKPERVVPFKITKEECVERYRAIAKKQIYAPHDLLKLGKADSFRGIYMPFWSFDVRRNGEFRFPAKKVITTPNQTITTEYLAKGKLDARHEGLSHDASLSFEDAVSEKIIPYEQAGEVRFSECYLNGFYANAADQTAEDCLPQVMNMERAMIVDSAKHAFDDIGLLEDKAESQLHDKDAYTINPVPSMDMYPVWFLSYRHKDRVSYATVNGQTGKVYADFPASPFKYLLFSLLTAVPVFLFLNLFLTASPSIVMFFAMIVALCFSTMYKHEVEDIYERVFRVNYSEQDRKRFNMKKLWEIVMTVFVTLLCCIHVVILLIMGLKQLGFFGTDKASIIFSGACVVLFAIRFFKMRGRFMALTEVKTGLTNGLFLLASIVALVTSIVRPADDMFYYAVAYATVGIVAFSVVSLISCYNKLSSQKPKQFNRSGGDDDNA